LEEQGRSRTVHDFSQPFVIESMIKEYTQRRERAEIGMERKREIERDRER
jgi:hypothetical protein